MYCKNCGNNLDNNVKFCSNCGIQIQNFKQDNISSKTTDKWIKILGISIGILVVMSFIILFSGVVIGVGSGYDNPNSTFDFAPYGISFSIMNIINIVLVVVIIILNKNKRSG